MTSSSWRRIYITVSLKFKLISFIEQTFKPIAIYLNFQFCFSNLLDLLLVLLNSTWCLGVYKLHQSIEKGIILLIGTFAIKFLLVVQGIFPFYSDINKMNNYVSLIQTVLWINTIVAVLFIVNTASHY